MTETPADKNLKYQVFISFKNTDASGNITPDTVIAEEIYDFLTEKGIKVFFSKVTLPNLGASQYQKEIGKALEEADILILVATRKENIEAEWVQQEWSSFQGEILSNRKPNGKFFNYFKNVDMKDIPFLLRNNQTFYHTG
ncbi:MAG TPA: toll/interleukin-1 receptor domain-containing protein, partial [Candidatus Wallbacteria bacterium]|nr:toll/interleukin-1 receptor domain-containing protein [Candidatus Wallbacteria bacterium]